MDIGLSTIVQRLTCPAFQPVSAGSSTTRSNIPSYLRGRMIHAAAESYLRDELLSTFFNLLKNLTEDDPEAREELLRMGCNLLSFMNQSIGPALPVIPEAPLELTVPAGGKLYKVHGRADCVVQTSPRPLVLDWKPSPRSDGLDVLQVRFYLAAVLIQSGKSVGDWLIWYYQGGLARGADSLDDLLESLRAALLRMDESNTLRPGPHCSDCFMQGECEIHERSMVGVSRSL